MQPNNIRKVKSIVNYHWSPKKKREMQRNLNKITEPIELQTLEEVWETIRQRKEGKMEVSNILQGLNISREYQIYVDGEERKSPPKRSSPPRASPPRASPPRGSPGNETKDWSFVADSDILTKELQLGKELLKKAQDKISHHVISQIVSGDQTEDERAVVTTMVQLLEIAHDGSTENEQSWEKVVSKLEERGFVDKMNNYSSLVEANRVNSTQV